MTRRHRGFTAIHPSGLPQPVTPGWNGDPWAFPSGFAPRSYPRRTPRRGRSLRTGPGTTPSTSAEPPSIEYHSFSCDLVSHDPVQPRVVGNSAAEPFGGGGDRHRVGHRRVGQELRVRGEHQLPRRAGGLHPRVDRGGLPLLGDASTFASIAVNTTGAAAASPLASFSCGRPWGVVPNLVLLGRVSGSRTVTGPAGLRRKTTWETKPSACAITTRSTPGVTASG